LTRRAGNGKAASPQLVTRCGRSELVEIDRCGGVDRRTLVAECARGGGTIDGSDSGKMDHIEVGTGHELNVERLPSSSRVWVPPDRASCTLLKDLTGARTCRIDVRQSSQCDGQDDSQASAARKHCMTEDDVVAALAKRRKKSGKKARRERGM